MSKRKLYSVSSNENVWVLYYRKMESNSYDTGSETQRQTLVFPTRAHAMSYLTSICETKPTLKRINTQYTYANIYVSDNARDGYENDEDAFGYWWRHTLVVGAIFSVPFDNPTRDGEWKEYGCMEMDVVDAYEQWDYHGFGVGCPNCGTYTDNSWNYCQKCGVRLDARRRSINSLVYKDDALSRWIEKASNLEDVGHCPNEHIHYMREWYDGTAYQEGQIRIGDVVFTGSKLGIVFGVSWSPDDSQWASDVKITLMSLDGSTGIYPVSGLFLMWSSTKVENAVDDVDDAACE